MKLASVAQTNYIHALLKERVVPADLIDVASSDLNIADASRVIGALKDCPRQQGSSAAPQSVGCGFYRQGDTFYEVVQAKNGARFYAKEMIVGAGWVFAPGAMKVAHQWTPLTLEEAKQFGKKYGVCVACGRTLTNSDSIEAGIGPICAGRF